MKIGTDYTGICIIFYCHDGKGNFVMAKRSTKTRDEHGRWDIGGGGLELHDTVENTIRKEIKEEYCTDVKQIEFLGYRDVHRQQNGVKNHWIALDFKVLVDRKKVAIGEPEKFDDIAWYTLETYPKNNSHSQFPVFISQYRDKLR